MSLTIRKQFVISRDYTYAGTNGKRYITIHETANTSKGADAQAHANLQTRGFSSSFHWQVDDKEAIQSYPHDVRCWHGGDGRGNGNLNSIAIEICVNSDGDFKQAVRNAAKLTAKIMRDENISLTNVVQHNRWSGKNCPTYLRNGSKGVTWAQFIAMVKDEYSGGVSVVAGSKSYLSRGDKGADVTELQRKLIELGYDLGRYGADGDFGATTESAVKAFQKDAGLADDGLFGKQSQDALEKRLQAKRNPPKPAPKKDDSPSEWASEAWEIAKNLGITDGSNPQGIPTREQVVTMIVRALNLKDVK